MAEQIEVANAEQDEKTVTIKVGVLGMTINSANVRDAIELLQILGSAMGVVQNEMNKNSRIVMPTQGQNPRHRN